MQAFYAFFLKRTRIIATVRFHY